MLPQPCAEPGCPAPAHYRGRCPEHARQSNRANRSANAKLYSSKRWQMTRRRKLAETPLCEADGCENIAEHVHHRKDLSAGGDPWGMANLESLCAGCHNRTTRARQIEP